jgi:hypothetical protein
MVMLSPGGTMVRGTSASISGLRNRAIDCYPIWLSITSWIWTRCWGATART